MKGDQGTTLKHNVDQMTCFGLGYFFPFASTQIQNCRKHLWFLSPTDVPNYDMAGVPYSIQGFALRSWVMEETNNPTKAEGDWRAYQKLKIDRQKG